MMDVAKASAALERPGIDPRTYADLGVVTAVAVDSDGVHVDITTSGGLMETAALVPPYAGPGYGLHLPIDLDEAVAVMVPDGRWNAGARVVGRLWDAGAPPPQEVIDNPDDVVLVVKPGRSMRIVITGGGDALIEATGGGKVRIGGSGGESPPMKVSDGTVFMNALDAAILALSAAPIPQAALSALKNALELALWPAGATSVTVR